MAKQPAVLRGSTWQMKRKLNLPRVRTPVDVISEEYAVLSTAQSAESEYHTHTLDGSVQRKIYKLIIRTVVSIIIIWQKDCSRTRIGSEHRDKAVGSPLSIRYSSSKQFPSSNVDSIGQNHV